MAGKGNKNKLQPVRTKREASLRGRNGGIRSGEARRAKKSLRETVLMLLNGKCTEAEAKKRMADLGISAKEMTNQMAMTVSMFQEAMSGNVQAFNSLRDTAGEKPATEITGKNGEPISIMQERELTAEEAAAFYTALDKKI